MKEEKIREILTEIFTREEYDDYFLVDLKAPDQSHKIQVFLDGDEGINSSICKAISRELEKILDEANWVPEKYILEVSSPGVKRPLIKLRQFPQHIGRDFKISLKSGAKVHGELMAVEGDSIVVLEKKKKKQGKSRKEIIEERTIDFDTIKEALVKITFK